jgi:hypothetical protein
MSDCFSRLLSGAAIIVLLACALLVPASALAVSGAGATCPDTTQAPSSTAAICEESGPGDNPGGGGSTDFSGLLPIVATVAGVAVLALVAAFIFFRRRAAAPAVPADPGEWWTCRNCGRNNVIGSPRCYACGEWQG